MKRILLALVLTLLCSSAVAQEVFKYVNDYLVITLRTGPSNQFKVEKTLGTGTRLTVIDETAENGYIKVRTDAGTEGWALIQYLVDEPVARLLLVTAQNKLAKLEKEHQQLQKRHKELSSQSGSTSKERDQLEQQADKLSKELASLKKVAARPLELESENKRLSSQMVELNNKLRITEEKNQALEDSEARQWFAIGAIVLFAGIFLGWVLPKLKPQRRDSWGGM